MSHRLLVLARQRLLSRNLLFRLLVAVRNEPVKEAPWPSLRVVLRLSLVDLTLQGTGRFVVNIVLIFDFVEVCCTTLAFSRDTGRHAEDLRFLSCMESFLLIFSLIFSIASVRLKAKEVG